MNYQAELDRAAFALRNQVGLVLSSGQEIITLQDRASKFRSTGSPAVNAQAEAVMAKANGLITNYRAIERSSIDLIGQANVMREQMATDPVWKAILSGNVVNAGYAYITSKDNKIGAATTLAQRLAALATQAQAHLNSVADLRASQNNLENFAQGKGVRATLASVGGFAQNYLSMIKFAAVGVGLFFVWDIAKPFVAGRKRT